MWLEELERRIFSRRYLETKKTLPPKVSLMLKYVLFLFRNLHNYIFDKNTNSFVIIHYKKKELLLKSNFFLGFFFLASIFSPTLLILLKWYGVSDLLDICKCEFLLTAAYCQYCLLLTGLLDLSISRAWT